MCNWLVGMIVKVECGDVNVEVVVDLDGGGVIVVVVVSIDMELFDLVEG